jgi:isoamylase
MADADVTVSEGRAQPLGSTYDGRGTNFSVYSSVADRVEVCLFDDEGGERRVTLTARTGDCWHGYFEAVGPGQRYGIRVHGPWNPLEGHLCSPEKLLLDPYGGAVDGAIEWDASLFPLDPAAPDEPANRTDSAPFVPRSVVIDRRFDWEDDQPPDIALADTIIYETHVKGFTARRPEIPPGLRGSYAGMSHPAAIEHLVRLGVTAVELLPVQQFIHRRRLTAMGLRNYWGYDPVCHFAPHNEYASDRRPGAVVTEFKRMVKALHAARLHVILDVVFNHTGEGGSPGPVLGFKGLDNRTYYRLGREGGLQYVDWTGTRNTLDTEHPQVRRMILDALRYWTSEMHVDGFRFDLAPVLAREGDRIDFDGGLFEAIRTDPVLRRVKLIAEPWDLGEGGYQLGHFPAGWSEWNDRFRDDVRDFWIGRGGKGRPFMARIAGSPDVFRAGGRPPQASVNFVTCHDGFTLQDLVSYESKHNEANGEDNRDGHGDNHSWNCGVEGPTDDANIVALRERQKRNLLASLLLSQGVPMLLGGDEAGHTQYGNNNAYCQDNEVSWTDWVESDGNLVDFVAALIRLRKGTPALRRTEWLAENGGGSDQTHRMSWYDAGGGEIGDAAGENSDDAPPIPLQVLIPGPVVDEDVLILLNPTDDDAAFEPPASHSGGAWYEVLDTGSDRAQKLEPAPRTAAPVGVGSRTLVVLARRAPAAGTDHPRYP